MALNAWVIPHSGHSFPVSQRKGQTTTSGIASGDTVIDTTSTSPHTSE